ncbi:class I SAM-dependent methyltransferase [Catellatospora sp. NPDC049609]|uniref:class I SAM-dependent methyltransferase n=1 Tax=Catellatospora sp. NPDC049609 TaxID=3155505 RepID=UPI003419B16E
MRSTLVHHDGVQTLLETADIDRLRTALTGAGFTASGIAARLGPQASADAGRHDFRAALHVTGSGDPLDTLIRLFICGQTEPEAAVAAALHPLTLAAARAAGLVELADGGLTAGVDLEPYGDWWVLSDLPAQPGRQLPADHVLGVGGASTTLAGATVRRPVGAALDLGTGCGVQALHLSTHARTVTATDLSPRALRFAATTAALNGLSWELLQGDMLAPVEGRQFDLVVSNPPFVVGPGLATHVYRDSGRAGDGVCAELAGASPKLLSPGGTLQFLANWVHVRGEDWEDRVAGWFAGTGMDVWAIQREVSDPLDYVRLWLADASEKHDAQRAAQWLDWFAAHDVTAIGFGLVTARNSGKQDPSVVCEDLRQQVQAPLGERVAEWFARRDWLDTRDEAQLLAARYRRADGLQLRQEATMGDEGWMVDRQFLAMPEGLRWVEEIDPLILALVSGADGHATLADQISLLSAAHEAPQDALTQALLPVLDHLVERGLLIPA